MRRYLTTVLKLAIGLARSLLRCHVFLLMN